jgi:hypothetical protein
MTKMFLPVAMIPGTPALASNEVRLRFKERCACKTG